MKIKKSQLQKIIKEEVKYTLLEQQEEPIVNEEDWSYKWDPADPQVEMKDLESRVSALGTELAARLAKNYPEGRPADVRLRNWTDSDGERLANFYRKYPVLNPFRPATDSEITDYHTQVASTQMNWSSYGAPLDTEPTEEETDYFVRLGQLEDIPGIDPRAASTVRAAQFGTDPVYDPDYIPYKLRPYELEQEEEYVPAISIDMPWDELQRRVDLKQGIHQRDRADLQSQLQRAVKRIGYWERLFPFGQEYEQEKAAIKNLRKKLEAQGEFDTEKIKKQIMTEWEKEQGRVIEEGDLVGASALRFNVMGRKRYSGVPHLRQLFTVLSQFGNGRHFIGDISQPGGGKISAHGSHRGGIDGDIAFFVKAGAPGAIDNMSVRAGEERDPGHNIGVDGLYCGGTRRNPNRRCNFKGKTVFRHSKTDEFEYNRNVELMRVMAPMVQFFTLNIKFKQGIEARMRELVQKGQMSQAERARLKRAMDWDKSAHGHDDHIHFRSRGVYQKTHRRWDPASQIWRTVKDYRVHGQGREGGGERKETPGQKAIRQRVEAPPTAEAPFDRYPD